MDSHSSEYFGPATYCCVVVFDTLAPARQDVDSIFHTVPDGKPIEFASGMEARWIEAGHLLGSASIQLSVTEKGVQKTVTLQIKGLTVNDCDPQHATAAHDA